MIKSKAQLERFKQLVKEKKMEAHVLEKLIKETPEIHKLPDRIAVDSQVSEPSVVKTIRRPGNTRII